MVNTKLRDEYEIEFDEIIMQDEIKRQCNLSVSWNDVIDFVNTSPYSLLFIDSKLNSSSTIQPDTKYLLFNTGHTRPGSNSYIFCSMIMNYDQIKFFSCYVGVVEFLLKKSATFLKLKPSDMNTKIIKIQEKLNNEYKEFGKIYAASNAKPNPSFSSNNNVEDMVQSEMAKIMAKAGVNIQNIPIKNNSSSHVSSYNNANDSNEALYFNENSNLNTSSVNNNHNNLNYSKFNNSNPIPIIDVVYNSLLFNNWKDVSGLARFIKIIGGRVHQLIKQNKDEYYILNKLNSVVVNTGLLDKYNNDILILYKWFANPGKYKPDKVIESKKDLIDEGFDMSQIKKSITPISFFDGDMYISNVDLDDFDISNKTLDHILEERITRFPEDIRNLPLDVLATKIRTSLETGVKMLQRDKTYARPSYSGESNKMIWLFPLHINRSFSEEPELVMVIGKEEYYYEIKTIYVYNDSIKDRITAMELYRTAW